MAENVNTPRREAGVLSDEELTEEQRAAGKKLRELIAGMVDSKEKVDRPKLGFLPRIDGSRTSRVLLIDGGRGSGKTALLLTMLEAWRRGVTAEPPSSANLSYPPDQIVPIGLLDLHPLPPSTNLLFHVIGRFERVVEWLEGEEGDKGKDQRPPAIWQLDDELDSRKRWGKLLRAVAAGWDGGATERCARPDTDARAVELEEAERQRLNLVDTFASFVDALAEDYARKQRFEKAKLPLFVLAVDDADTDAGRAVELLETVRMLWHPRVAFVLSGDSKLFLQTLAERTLGELRQPLAHHHFLESELQAVAADRPVLRLAYDIYEKIIPPGHRCEIPPLRWDFSAKKLPAVLQDLVEQLRKVPIDRSPFDGNTKWSLADYFKHDAQLADALPDRLRGVIDLTEFVKDESSLTKLKRTDLARRVVDRMWGNAMDRDGVRWPGLRRVIERDPLTGVLRIRERTPNAAWGIDGLTKVVLRPVNRDEVATTFQRWEQMDVLRSGEVLPRSVTAMLKLAGQLRFDHERVVLHAAPSDLTGRERFFVRSEHARSSSVRLAWPLPKGWSPSFYSAFSLRWNHCLDKASKDASADAMAPLFLRIVIDMLWRNTLPDKVGDGEARTASSVIPPEPWRALADDLWVLLRSGDEMARDWALRAAPLLAAPEYGLSSTAANTWLTALQQRLSFESDDDWSDLLKLLPAEREEAFANAGDKQPARTILRLNAEFKKHDWHGLIERDRGDEDTSRVKLVAGFATAEKPANKPAPKKRAANKPAPKRRPASTPKP